MQDERSDLTIAAKLWVNEFWPLKDVLNDFIRKGGMGAGISTVFENLWLTDKKERMDFYFWEDLQGAIKRQLNEDTKRKK